MESGSTKSSTWHPYNWTFSAKNTFLTLRSARTVGFFNYYYYYLRWQRAVKGLEMCPFTVSMCVSPVGSPETSRQDGGGAGGPGQDDQPAGSVWPCSEGQETTPHLTSQSTCHLHAAILCDSIAADALNARPFSDALAGRLQSNAFKDYFGFSCTAWYESVWYQFSSGTFFLFCFLPTIITQQANTGLRFNGFCLLGGTVFHVCHLLTYLIIVFHMLPWKDPSILFPCPFTCSLLPGTPHLVLFSTVCV